MEDELYFRKGEDHSAFRQRLESQQHAQTDKYYQMLPEGDLEMIVMKGHLMIEQRMSNLMKAMSNRPGCIDKSNLNYSQLSWCCKALTPSHHWDDDEVWRTVAKINEARNCIAHELEPGKKLRVIMKEAYKLLYGRYYSNRKATENTRQMLAELLSLLGYMISDAGYINARTRLLI